ncbi:sialidase-4-like isoform X2 [Asterias rubens]|uniref:sialidase-4-like isoform X2 n=1 Tax=Asterias rubens TaxID=7604 RepID=UPI00145552D7|nr:sialidase-4-like isoform X2 [Asterias rubens]
MLLRVLKMTIKTLLVNLRPSKQLLFITLCVCAVIVLLIKLQKPLEANFNIKAKEALIKKPVMPVYTITQPFETDLETIYKRGFSGYNTFRIPALVHHQDMFLAFCEARKETHWDIGAMDLIVRRGKRSDWEVEWGDIILIATKPGYRLMNPTAIVDREIEAIVLVFIAIPANLDQWDMIKEGRVQQQVMVTRSFDNGLTWTPPSDITDGTLRKMSSPPGIYASGPGHGIQTASGRLIVPGNYFVKDKYGALLNDLDNFYNTTNHASVMISNDHGLTWHMGGHIQFDFDRTWRPIHTSEAMIVELQDGELVLNARTLHQDLPRVQAVSMDDGYTFSKGKLASELIEPGYKIVENETIPSKAGGCQASLTGFPAPHRTETQNTWVAFSNPASSSIRENMSIRISRDGCKTWSKPWTIYPYRAAYSDLTYFETTDPVTGLKQQNFAILFEGGKHFSFKKIMFKMFNLDAVLTGIQRTYRRLPQTNEASETDYY